MGEVKGHSYRLSAILAYMPTLNEYANQPGYYIRAWTPDTGNINYKLRSRANPVIRDYNLHDGDEISWDVINSLKAIGVVYTEKSGTIRTDEFEPDPEQVQETSLNDHEARKLLEVLQENLQLSGEELEHLCSILGVEPPQTLALDRMEDSLESQFQQSVSAGEFPFSAILGTSDHEESHPAVSIEELEEEPKAEDFAIEFFLFAGEETSDRIIWNIHVIQVSRLEGLEDWTIVISGDQTWEKTSELLQQMSQLVPMVVGELRSIDIDPGSSENLPIPEIRDFEEILEGTEDMP